MDRKVLKYLISDQRQQDAAHDTPSGTIVLSTS